MRVLSYIVPVSLVIGLVVGLHQRPFHSISEDKNRIAPIEKDDFLRVRGTRFYGASGGQFFMKGMNYWSCMNLAAEEDAGGNVTRLRMDLDVLRSIGVNVIRVMAATQGAASVEPFRIYPALQTGPESWDRRMFLGLDRCVYEAGQRGIRVIMVMGNTWQWTGGIAQLHSWSQGNASIPYPHAWDIHSPPQRQDGHPGWGNFVIPEGGGDEKFMEFQSAFYRDAKAQDIFRAHLDVVMDRTNSVNGRTYSNDPIIAAWEPLNEPQALSQTPSDDAMIQWHLRVSQRIKSKAPKQLSTTGSEAKFGKESFQALHADRAIDFACTHLWAELWGHYDRMDPSQASLHDANRFATTFLSDVDDWALELDKPVILEEFGMARDAWQNKGTPFVFHTNATTMHRDAYFSHIYHLLTSRSRSAFAGLFPWSYGGSFRSDAQKANRFGMLFAGDPPQEPPGWFSILDDDRTTLGLIQSWGQREATNEPKRDQQQVRGNDNLIQII